MRRGGAGRRRGAGAAGMLLVGVAAGAAVAMLGGFGSRAPSLPAGAVLHGAARPEDPVTKITPPRSAGSPTATIVHPAPTVVSRGESTDREDGAGGKAPSRPSKGSGPQVTTTTGPVAQATPEKGGDGGAPGGPVTTSRPGRVTTTEVPSTSSTTSKSGDGGRHGDN